MQPGTKKLLTLICAFLGTWLAVRFLLPLTAPFLFGTALALASEPAVRLLSGRFRLPRSLGAGIGVSLTFLLLCTVLLGLCAFTLRELSRLSAYLPQLAQSARTGVSAAQVWLLALSEKVPASLRPLLRENVNTLFSSGTMLLDQILRYIPGFAGDLLSHIPNSALTVGTAVLSGYMISAKLPQLRQKLLQKIPQPRLRKLRRLNRKLRCAASGWLLAQLKLMSVTFFILLAGFWLLRISPPLLLAAGICAVDAFPVLGTGTVLLPWSLFRLLQGDTPRFLGLLGIYVTVSLVRSLLEPKLVGKQLGLDPLATLMSLYAGFRLWGIGGMLLAPLLTVTAMQILPERGTDRQNYPELPR